MSMDVSDRITYRMVLCSTCTMRREYDCHALDDDIENCIDVGMEF